MTPEEYKAKIAEIEEEASKKKNKVGQDYAFAHNPYNVGDIIKDHIGSIRIDEIKWRMDYLSSWLPYCVYNGLEVKKDGTPKKNAAPRTVHQHNILP